MRARRTSERWAARCWHWLPGIDTSEDDDLAYQQKEQWVNATSEADAHRAGRELAAHERATSPGLYDVMRGVPDARAADGWRWETHEEVRP